MRFFLNYIILENIWNLSLIGFMAIYRQPNIQIIFKCKIDLQKKSMDRYHKLNTLIIILMFLFSKCHNYIFFLLLVDWSLVPSSTKQLHIDTHKIYVSVTRASESRRYTHVLLKFTKRIANISVIDNKH
jgi:hypothetical protein